MEDYTAEMIRDMAFPSALSAVRQSCQTIKADHGSSVHRNAGHGGNNTHPKPENWKTVRSKICPVCGRVSLPHQYGLERKYCSRACTNKGRWKEGDANGRTAEHRT